MLVHVVLLVFFGLNISIMEKRSKIVSKYSRPRPFPDLSYLLRRSKNNILTIDWNWMLFYFPGRDLDSLGRIGEARKECRFLPLAEEGVPPKK